MGFLAMAGFEANEIIEAMPATLDLAAAGMVSLGDTADIVSNIMSGFGIEAENLGEVSDILTATFTSSNTSLQQLGEAMSYAAPIAQSMGVSIEKSAAAVGIISNAGIQASRAGTTLARALTVLATETDKLGVNVRNAEGDLLELPEILRRIEEAGISSEEILATFGQRAGPGMQVLLAAGSDELRNYTQELSNAGGIAKDVAETQMEGLNG